MAVELRPSKRSRLVAAVAGGLPLRTQAASSELSRADLRGELHKHDSTTTPYGPLFKTMSLQTTSGGFLDVLFLCPFAVLWLMGSKYVTFAGFVGCWLVGKMCRLVLYCDGITPGNPLRPDHGRSLEAFYWTFMEWPNFFRNRGTHGWFSFTFIEARLVEQVKGGLAAIAKAVLKQFYSPVSDHFDLSRTGVCVGPHHVRAEFAAWMSDERALKDVLSTKGATGNKPCCWCRNVVGRTRPRPGSTLVHFDCSDEARFELHSIETFNAMVDDLVSQVGVLSARDFAFRERVLSHVR